VQLKKKDVEDAHNVLGTCIWVFCEERTVPKLGPILLFTLSCDQRMYQNNKNNIYNNNSTGTGSLYFLVISDPYPNQMPVTKESKIFSGSESDIKRIQSFSWIRKSISDSNTVRIRMMFYRRNSWKESYTVSTTESGKSCWSESEKNSDPQHQTN
jgi:hypothetical protein